MLARQIAARAFYLSGIWRVLAKRPAFRILMYHRIVEPNTLPYPIEPGMYVRPESFALQCEFMKREMQVLPLSDLVELALANKPPPPRSLAITFDDGYQDFYQNALPTLTRLGLPATVFLPTAFIGTERMFSYDLFAAQLERARNHPELREKFFYALDDARLRELVDLLYHGESNGSTEALSQIIRRLKELDRTQRGIILEALASLSATGFYPRTFMSWSEVRECQEIGITFASHSHNHPYLDEQSAEEILEDTRLASATLAKHKISTLDYYCFPNGNFNPTALTVLSSLGVQACFATGSRGSKAYSGEYVRERRDNSPAVFTRIGLHDDISATNDTFLLRMLPGSNYVIKHLDE